MGAIVWIGIVVVGLAALIWLIVMPITIDLTVDGENWEYTMNMMIVFLGIHGKAHWTIPELSKLSSLSELKTHGSLSRHHQTHMATIIHGYIKVQRVMNALWRRIEILHLDLVAEFGFRDASTTALWFGRFSELAANWITARIMPPATKVPNLKITPRWDDVGVKCYFRSIIRVRPSDIILATLIGLFA